MSDFIYTIDPPDNSPAWNKRLGYRTPRSILLPPHLVINQYFVDYAESIDTVFSDMVDEKTEILRGLRNMWVSNPTMEETYVLNEQLIPFEGWSQPERQILVKQVNMLGLKLQSAGLISNDQYQTISRWVGEYWFGKGTHAFIDFINYCLSSKLTVTKLWTQDYVNFVPEGDPSIGTPIWEGGPWYPTTHVDIIASGGLQSIDPQSLINFFYEIANYNLVLHSLELAYDMYMVDTLIPGYQDATIVAMGIWANSEIVLSNLFRYGGSPPPTYDVSPAVPTSALVVSQPSGTTGLVMMAAPTGWILDPTGNKVYPVYTTLDMVETEGPDIPTTLCGGPSTNGQVSGYAVIYGPPNWQKVPGSSRTTARIPSFPSIPVPMTVLPGEVPTQIVGNLRANLLVNPDGWDDFTGTGQFTPFWYVTP